MAKESEAKIRFSVFNEDYKRGLKEINDENRRMKNEFKLTEAQMKNNSTESEKLETRIKRLGNEKENVTKKVKLTEEQLEKAKRVYGENSTEALQLGDELVKLQASEQRLQNAIDDTNVELVNQRNEMERAEAERFAKQIQDAGKSVEDLGDKLQKQGKKIGDFGKAWSLRITAPILAAAGAALKVGMDFEEGMSQVQALTGATGEDLEELKLIARDLGATTRFSATEAADAMGFLGMAGWETTEIMSGLPGVLDLAASSNMDLGRAADVTSNIMSAFNMEASESARISDLLAHAASSANTNVDQMAEAMKYLAPVANTLNMSIEDATAAVMANADAGIQGSMAGRTFASSLSRLANPTAAMKDEMKKLNIEFFNAEGQLKPLPEIVGDLEHAMGDYDNKTRAATLSTLFGTEAQKNWAIILESGSEALAENSQALAESEGAASKMAEIMQDNAKGALTEFRSATEGAAIAFAEHMLPAVTDIITGITDMVRRFGDLDDEQQKQIIKWALLVAAVGPAVKIFGDVTRITGGLLSVSGRLITKMGTAKGAGLIAKFTTLGAVGGPVVLAAVAVGGLAGAIYLLNQRTQESTEDIYNNITARREEIDELDKVIAEYELLLEKNKLTTDEMLRYMDVLDELKKADSEESIQALKEELEELLNASGLTNDEMEEFLRLNDTIVEKAPEVVDAISDQGNAYVSIIDNIKELNQLERDRLLADTYNEITEEINRQERSLERQAKLQEDIKDLEENRSDAINQIVSRNEEIRAIDQQIYDLQLEKNGATEQELEFIYMKERELREERDTLVNIVELHDASIDRINGQIEKKQESIAETDKELEYFNKLIDEYQQMVLYQADIVFEKGKTNEALWKEQELIDENRKKLDEMKASGALVGAEYDEQNKKLNDQQHNLDDAVDKLLHMNNVAGDLSIPELQIRTSQSIESFEASWSRAITKRININSRINGPAAISAYAKGTNYHKGGPALVGEEGPELAKMRGKYELLTFGVRNLERGTKVYTAKQTEKIFKSGKVPSYATGVGNTSLPTNLGESLARSQSTVNNRVVVVVEPSDVNLDNRQIGSMQWKVVKEFIDRDNDIRSRFGG